MKKLLSIVLSLIVLSTMSFDASAMTGSLSESEAKIPLPISKDEIVKRVEEYGQNLPNLINGNSRYVNEKWVLDNTQTLVSMKCVDTAYVRALTTNETENSQVSFNFGVGTEIEGYSIDIGFSGSESTSFSGPSFSDTVGNSGIAATHSAVSGAQFGQLNRYTYKVYDLLDRYLRTEVRTVLVDGGTYLYNHKINIGNPQTRVEGTNRSTTKIYTSMSMYINKLNSNNPSAIFF